jgi:hypothetical protein
MPRLASAWLSNGVVGAENAGEMIIACTGDTTEIGSGEMENRSQIMHERLCSVGELLFAVASSTQSASAGSLVAGDRSSNAYALAISSSKLSSHDLPATPDAKGLYAEMLAARSLALSDLNEAINLLNAELVASSVIETLRAGDNTRPGIS